MEEEVERAAGARRPSAPTGAGLLPALLAAGGLLLAGCPASSPKQPADKTARPQAKTGAGSDQKPPGAAPQRAKTATAGTDLTLTVIDKAGYERFLRQHRGRVVLVDFWATWCTSCIDLLPHNVELQKRFADQGLVVATVSMDELDDPDDPQQQAPVRKVLASKAATLQNLIVRPARPGQPDTDPFRVFAIPGGALPHLELYDRDGKLHRTFDSKAEAITAEAIDRAVQGLLGTASKAP